MTYVGSWGARPMRAGATAKADDRRFMLYAIAGAIVSDLLALAIVGYLIAAL